MWKNTKLPLTHLNDGESGIVVSITGSRRSSARHRRRWGLKRRLEDMGLTPGVEVKVVKSAPFRGPLELEVRGSKLAIGRGMAERVLVRVDK